MIFLYPTDTVYGLGVDARDAEAVRALRALKGSGGDKHYSIAVSDISMMREYAEMTPLSEKLAAAFLPGKLTLVLTARNLAQELSDDGTVGIRIPNNPEVYKLIKKIGGPITATSANVSGMQTMNTVTDILEQFGTKRDLIQQVPDCPEELPHSAPSTVVDARGTTPILIREGAINKLAIEEVLR